MPSYLDIQVNEALRKAKGNQTKARAVLIQMATEDERLLMALAKPYLNAMAAQALNHQAAVEKKIKAKAGAAPPVPKSGKGTNEFGLDLLKALGGPNVAKFGQESAAPPIRKKAASSQHVNALKMMASKSKTPPKK